MCTCWSRWWGGSSFLPFGRLHGHTPDEGVVYAHQDVLWFDVRVDDFTFGVEVVQTLQDLQTHFRWTHTHGFNHRSHVCLHPMPSELFSPPCLCFSFIPSLVLEAKFKPLLMLSFSEGREQRLFMFPYTVSLICFFVQRTWEWTREHKHLMSNHLQCWLKLK